MSQFFDDSNRAGVASSIITMGFGFSTIAATITGLAGYSGPSMISVVPAIAALLLGYSLVDPPSTQSRIDGLDDEAIAELKEKTDA
ncbi:hypothetical protein [Halobellus ordinarius]|uniref:hypothetical protein n=1 Tax=Halobellus ordinarius TaxID=3075120 RepID=UPI002880484A|nr:hypothetical protein [Halobellus sp. ZY16]